MTHTYTAHFQVRQYELNAQNELPISTVQRLFQETATLATRDAGFDVTWYAERHSIWVVHQMTIEYRRTIQYPAELAITTWLSDMQKVRTQREYLARDVAGGEIVACGQADWAYLNSTTLSPMRIPPDVIERFHPNGIRAVQRAKPRTYPLPANVAPIEFHTTRHVQHYEADMVGHVNNAVYIDWLEEAVGDAVANRFDTSWRLCVRRHDIEYARSAIPGDVVEISASLVGIGHCASVWRLEVRRGEELLVRDRVTAVWKDHTGKLVRWK